MALDLRGLATPHVAAHRTEALMFRIALLLLLAFPLAASAQTTSTTELACSTLPTVELEALARGLLPRTADFIRIDSAGCLVILGAPPGGAARIQETIRLVEEASVTRRRRTERRNLR